MYNGHWFQTIQPSEILVQDEYEVTLLIQKVVDTKQKIAT